MMRKLVLVGFMLFAFSRANSQSLNLDNLIELTKRNYNESANYLTKNKNFKLISSQILYGTTIMQFARIAGVMTELVVKSQFKDVDHIVHTTLHYEAKYSKKGYADTLIKQIERAQFKCTSKETDQLKKNWLFKNNKFTVTIYTFNDKALPWEIDIHGL